MPAYNKLGFSDFKARLKNGDYESATGARRAVGKCDWEDSEKQSAKTLIDKHFGVEATPAKAAKTPGGRKPRPEKAAKKATKAVKAAQTEEEAPAPAKRGRKPKAKAEETGTVEAAVRKVARAAKAASEEHTTSDLVESLTRYQNAVGVYMAAADTLKACATDGFNASEGLKAIGESLTRIVKSMDAHITTPLTAEESRGAALFQKAAAITPKTVAAAAAAVSPDVEDADEEEEEDDTPPPVAAKTTNGVFQPPTFVTPPKLPGVRV